LFYLCCYQLSFFLLQTLSLILVLTGSALPTKATPVKKDASEIKLEETIQPENVTENSRISRESSPLYTPASNIKYQYHYIPLSVLAHGRDTLEQSALSGNDAQYTTQQLQENYQNLPQKQQHQILAAFQAAKQPKSPVYHATPLQPYGALLKQTLGDSFEDKTVLVTPKPIVEHHEGEQPGEEKEAGGQSYYTTSNNAVGKHTEVIIPEPKYAPVVYKSLYQHHQSLHHIDDHEEPKNVSQSLQIITKETKVCIIKRKRCKGLTKCGYIF
jgi:hypothetical protein